MLGDADHWSLCRKRLTCETLFLSYYQSIQCIGSNIYSIWTHLKYGKNQFLVYSTCFSVSCPRNIPQVTNDIFSFSCPHNLSSKPFVCVLQHTQQYEGCVSEHIRYKGCFIPPCVRTLQLIQCYLQVTCLSHSSLILSLFLCHSHSYSLYLTIYCHHVSFYPWSLHKSLPSRVITLIFCCDSTTS